MVSDDRGQAFTLEGFIAAVVVLSALLFALQSIVITPSTGGQVGGQTERSLQQQAGDVLATNAESGNLSRVVRYWENPGGSCTGGDGDVSFYNASGFGYERASNIANGNYALGSLLNQTFEERGRPFNVVVEYHANSSTAGETRNVTVFRQGAAGDQSIVATQTVVLYDDQRLTAPGSEDTRLEAATECPGTGPGTAFEIPDAAPDSQVYNVVTVKVIVL